MSSATERIYSLYNKGVDRVSESEQKRRAEILSKIKPIESSKIPLHFSLRELIGESPDKDQSNIEMKFNQFLAKSSLYNTPEIADVIRGIAYAKIRGRQVFDNRLTDITIKEGKEIVESGAIRKLDGFDDKYKLAIAKKLFSTSRQFRQ